MHYFSRSQSRMMASEYPVGNPFGGPAYGEKTDIGSVVGAGVSLIGGSKAAKSSAKAADSAAKASQKAADQATQLQRDMYNQTRADNEPWRTGGGNALSKLLQGIGVQSSAAPDRGQIYNRLKDAYTIAVPAISAPTTPNSKKPQSYAEWNPYAENPYREAGAAGLKNYLLRISGRGGDDLYPMEPSYNPDTGYPDAITTRLNQLSYRASQPQMTTTIDTAGLNKAVDEEYARMLEQHKQNQGNNDPFYGSLLKSFTMADYEEDPGYQFRLTEGLKGLDRSAAARGGLQSGAALKAAANYSQDAASQEFGNAYNRYNTNKANQFNRLATVAGFGQQTNATNALAGNNYGNSVSGMMMQNGNNQANAALVSGANRGAAYQGLGNAMGGLNWNKFNWGGGQTLSDPSYYSDR